MCGCPMHGPKRRSPRLAAVELVAVGSVDEESSSMSRCQASRGPLDVPSHEVLSKTFTESRLEDLGRYKKRRSYGSKIPAPPRQRSQLQGQALQALQSW